MGLYKNRIVVKVGTSTLTNEMGKSDFRSFDRLACVLSDIQNLGYEVILVSSGAIAVGTSKLQMKKRPDSMRLKQAAAAVGQCSICFLYDKFFNDYDKTIAQILLNAEDMEHEEKKENLINTFNALLEMDIIPIVNENDSVSYTEIESKAVAKKLAEDYGYIYVDTGAMYRAMALYFLRQGIDSHDEAAIGRACETVSISLEYENGIQQVYLNGCPDGRRCV